MLFMLVMLGGSSYLACCRVYRKSLEFAELEIMKDVCGGEVSFLSLADSYLNLA